jgi:hypothetical protein
MRSGLTATEQSAFTSGLWSQASFLVGGASQLGTVLYFGQSAKGRAKNEPHCQDRHHRYFVCRVLLCRTGHVLGQTHEERAYKSLTVYGEVLQKIQSDYVDDRTCTW